MKTLRLAFLVIAVFSPLKQADAEIVHRVAKSEWQHATDSTIGAVGARLTVAHSGLVFFDYKPVENAIDNVLVVRRRRAFLYHVSPLIG